MLDLFDTVPIKKYCMSHRTRRCISASSTGRYGSLLDQMQRSVVGVTRDGGTVYKGYMDLHTSTTTGKSASSTSLGSGYKVVSVAGAIRARMNSLRGPSGRLDCFYRDLNVPKRNVPWSEYTEHTTVPINVNSNPQYLSDRSRHTTVNRAMGVNSVPDLSIPHVADKFRREASDHFKKAGFREFANQQVTRNKLRERAGAELDQRRVAFKTAVLSDYCDRVNGRFCHVT